MPVATDQKNRPIKTAIQAECPISLPITIPVPKDRRGGSPLIQKLRAKGMTLPGYVKVMVIAVKGNVTT